MADELTVTSILDYRKGTPNQQFMSVLKTLDVTGTNHIRNRQTIGTTEEAILMGDVAVGGYAIFVNRDATNFVSIRPGAGTANLIKIPAGEQAGPFRLAVAPFAIADTAAVELEYVLIDP